MEVWLEKLSENVSNWEWAGTILARDSQGRMVGTIEVVIYASFHPWHKQYSGGDGFAKLTTKDGTRRQVFKGRGYNEAVDDLIKHAGWEVMNEVTEA